MKLKRQRRNLEAKQVGYNMCCSLQASPDPVVTWLKDGLPLPNRATINTKDGTTQLLIGEAEFADSGIYTVELQNALGKSEKFSFQVQVTGNSLTTGYTHRFTANSRQRTVFSTVSSDAVKPCRQREN